MSVYVDPLKKYPMPKGARPSYSGGGKLWCHLIADTRDELDAMAVRLELKPAWFQDHKRQCMQHYDLTPSKRLEAIVKGAKPLTHKEFRDYLVTRIHVSQ